MRSTKDAPRFSECPVPNTPKVAPMILSRRAPLFLSLLALAVSGPATQADVFVSGFGNNAVLEYNGSTGAFIQTFASGGGLGEPFGLTFGPAAPAVPEPPSLVLAALGAIACLALAARQRRPRATPAPAA